MGRGSGLQFRLTLTLIAIGIVAIGGILAILPYRLYERDIRIATNEAHRISGVVQAALTCPLNSRGDASDLVNRIQLVGDLRVALSRTEAGELPAGALAGRGSSLLDDTDLRYVSTPVIADSGDAWVAEFLFDLSAMKRESLRLVFDMVLTVAIGSLAFGAVVFWFVRGAFVLPLRRLTARVDALNRGERDHPALSFESREMSDLADAIQRLGTRND